MIALLRKLACRVLGHKFVGPTGKGSYRTCSRCQTTWLWQAYKLKGPL